MSQGLNPSNPCGPYHLSDAVPLPENSRQTSRPMVTAGALVMQRKLRYLAGKSKKTQYNVPVRDTLPKEEFSRKRAAEDGIENRSTKRTIIQRDRLDEDGPELAREYASFISNPIKLAKKRTFSQRRTPAMESEVESAPGLVTMRPSKRRLTLANLKQFEHGIDHFGSDGRSSGTMHSVGDGSNTISKLTVPYSMKRSTLNPVMSWLQEHGKHDSQYNDAEGYKKNTFNSSKSYHTTSALQAAEKTAAGFGYNVRATKPSNLTKVAQSSRLNLRPFQHTLKPLRQTHSTSANNGLRNPCLVGTTTSPLGVPKLNGFSPSPRVLHQATRSHSIVAPPATTTSDRTFNGENRQLSDKLHIPINQTSHLRPGGSLLWLPGSSLDLPVDSVLKATGVALQPTPKPLAKQTSTDDQHLSNTNDSYLYEHTDQPSVLEPSPLFTSASTGQHSRFKKRPSFEQYSKPAMNTGTFGLADAHSPDGRHPRVLGQPSSSLRIAEATDAIASPIIDHQPQTHSCLSRAPFVAPDSGEEDFTLAECVRDMNRRVLWSDEEEFAYWENVIRDLSRG